MATKGLEAWVTRLCQSDMPVMATVVRELNELTGKVDTDVQQLANAIMKDANLTTQVLRIAASVQYNPTNAPINTISRAIVVVGFSGVRAICISLMMVDSLLGKNPRHHLLQCLANCFHAAVQARNLCQQMRPSDQEEVFVAALLYRIGEMAFWSSAKQQSEEMAEALLAWQQQGAADDDELSKQQLIELQQQVMGTSWDEITRELATYWNLGELLDEALVPPLKLSRKAAAVRFGHQVADAACHGWSSAEVDQVLFKLAKYQGISLVDMREQLLQGADEAYQVVNSYGASLVAGFLPPPADIKPSVSTVSGKKVEAEYAVVDLAAPLQSAVAEQSLDPIDPQQRQVQELQTILANENDLNALFRVVIQELQQRLGLARVVVAIIDGNKQILQAKYAIGKNTGRWRKEFCFPLDVTGPTLFNEIITCRRSIWINDDLRLSRPELFDGPIQHVLGAVSGFAAPICLGQRPVAICYGDDPDRRGLGDDKYQLFRLLMAEVEQAVIHIASRRRKQVAH